MTFCCQFCFHFNTFNQPIFISFCVFVCYFQYHKKNNGEFLGSWICLLFKTWCYISFMIYFLCRKINLWKFSCLHVWVGLFSKIKMLSGDYYIIYTVLFKCLYVWCYHLWGSEKITFFNCLLFSLDVIMLEMKYYVYPHVFVITKIVYWI